MNYTDDGMERASEEQKSGHVARRGEAKKESERREGQRRGWVGMHEHALGLAHDPRRRRLITTSAFYRGDL